MFPLSQSPPFEIIGLELNPAKYPPKPTAPEPPEIPAVTALVDSIAMFPLTLGKT
jgi:hypothetical protein